MSSSEHDENASEFGPGMDLMISLFAITMLIVALVSIQNDEQTVEGTIFDSGSVDIFEKNTSALTETGEHEVNKVIAEISEQLSDQNVNVIKLVGHASPDSRPIADGVDGNFNLSASRSITVIHYLHSLGIPYRCMSVEAHSSNQSLQTALAKDLLGLSETQFKAALKGDMTVIKPGLLEAFEQIEQDLGRDRRVEIIVSYETASRCGRLELLSAVQKAAQNGKSD